MTTALAALLLGVAGVALLLAFGAYLWLNRTPSTDERFDAYGRVPLFGVDLSAAEMRVDPDGELTWNDAVGGTTKKPRPLRTAEDVMSDTAEPDDSVAFDASTLEPDHAGPASFAPADAPAAALTDRPVTDARFSDPRLADAHYPDTRFIDTPPSNGAVPSTDHAGANPPRRPMNEPRSGRASWGASPGWPVSRDNGVGATPRYMPPVRTDPMARSSTPTPPSGANGNGISADGVSGSMIEGHQLRFSAPTEGTLQFLPGRLEISSGLDTGREIRFVRVPGPKGTEVTFGRNEGPLYRHIQLRDQTVSREHAQLVFADGQWTLTNLSRTNPVAHNGRILRLAEQQTLSDGDRLEMGEVVFSFRSR